MTKKQKIVIIGAGSLQFGLGTVGSILNSEALEGATITLHDINSRNLDLAFQGKFKLFRKCNNRSKGIIKGSDFYNQFN
jgi:alpha-galactosidase/6-phospho-beta-glucosidase family protein